MSRIATIVALAAAALLAACNEPSSRQERGENLYGYCRQCHGADASGTMAFRAPGLAGQHPWYIQAELDKFRVGARGDHPDDVDGLRMRPMSRTLANAEELSLVSEYIAELPTRPHPTTLDGDPERGRPLFTPCVQCHGERAAGNQQFNAPRLTVQGDWYLFAQLRKFKDGIRGADPIDTTGSQMRAMATTLVTEQAMKDVIAYISTLSSDDSGAPGPHLSQAE